MNASVFGSRGLVSAAVSCVVESMESRRLLAGITATLTNGALVVTGTNGSDSFSLQKSQANVDGGPGVTVNSGGNVIKSFRADKIKSILMDAKDGKDLVFISGNVVIPKVNGKDIPVTVRGGNGDDDVDDFRVATNSLVDGQGGNDSMFGPDTIRGGTGDDLISGVDLENNRGTRNYIDSGAGNDTVYGLGGSDTIFTQAGDDTVHIYNGTNADGTPGYSLVDTGDDNDTVDMQGGATVHMGNGNDRLDMFYYYDVNAPVTGGDFYGDAGNDRITLKYDTTPNAKRVFTAHGGDGNDILEGDSIHTATEHFYGDADDDTLYGGGGVNYFYGGSGNDQLSGGNKGDHLFGGDGNDNISGGGGYDELNGEGGDDRLDGGGDGDTLTGGTGHNQLTGGAGKDTIHAKNNSTDTIFGTEAGDILDRDSFDVLKAS